MNIWQKSKTSIIIFFCLVLLDRASKMFAWQVINFKNFAYTNYFFQPNLNKVLAFSLPASMIFIFFMSLLVLFFLFFWLAVLIKKRKYKSIFFLCLLIYGGISNLFDRVFYYGVIDFLYLGFLSVFNLADVYITVAVLFLFYFNFKDGEKYQR